MHKTLSIVALIIKLRSVGRDIYGKNDYIKRSLSNFSNHYSAHVLNTCALLDDSPLDKISWSVDCSDVSP